MPKPELEFFRADDVEWRPVPGGVPGLYERILASESASSVATRMLRFEPGTDTRPAGILTHDFWEEVYILEGAIRDVTLDQTFSAGMYACRPPGMKHGPWISEQGCTTFEVRYSQQSKER
jgi:ChrR Cupin-like domain